MATLRAQLALGGYALHLVSNEPDKTSFVIRRWDLTRPLSDLAAVEQFARQVVPPARCCAVPDMNTLAVAGEDAHHG